MSVFTKKEISNFVFNIIPILSQNSDETFKTTFIDKIYNYCIEETYIDLPLKLNILTNLWLYNSDYFNEEMKNSTLKLFKESIRNTFNNQELVLKDMISISHLFYLMEKFAKEKKENGPLLYKILVFLFIEEYDELPKREFFEENFSNFYLMNQTVPIDILITPYLKHLNNTKNYDICDFNFLAIILGHPRLKPEDAEKIVNFSLNVSLNNLLFGKCSNMLLDIIFSTGILKKDNKIYEKVQKRFSEYIREILSLYIMNIKKNIYDNAILEAPYDIMLESFGNVNANVHDTIVWAVEEYRRIKEKHSNALLGLLWFYSDHDEIILRLEEKYSKEIRIINNKLDYKIENKESQKSDIDLNKSIQDSVTKVLQKLKIEKDEKLKKRKEEIERKKIKEEKLKNNLEKQIAKKSLAMGIGDPNRINSILDISNNNTLIQDEGSIIREKPHNLSLIRPPSRMKLNTLLDFNQYKFIINLNEEEPREQKAIEAINQKYKLKIKNLIKILSNENNLITKASILRHFRDKKLNNNDITLDELSVCVRNCFNQNLNEFNQNQFKNLLVYISYFIMSKRRYNYTISECYYKFLELIIDNLNGKPNDIISNKYNKILSFLRDNLDKKTGEIKVLLPPGCKIVSKTDIIFKSKIPKTFLSHITESYRICYEILNEILSKILENGFLENYIKIKKVYDINIELGNVKNWSNGVMIAYSKLPKEYEKIGIEVADCLEDIMKKLLKGKDKNGNVIITNFMREKIENEENERKNNIKKEEMRKKRDKEIKEKVELYKKAKEEKKMKQIEEKEKEENEKKKAFHEMIIESKKRNKKILEEINKKKKIKEEEKLEKMNKEKEKEKELKIKQEEEKKKFFNEQNKKLSEQFKKLKTQKEKLIKQKLEKKPSNQKLPTISKNYLEEDKDYIEFDKNLTNKLEELANGNNEIGNTIKKYEEHLKFLFDMYHNLGKKTLSMTENNDILYLNEFKEFLLNFCILNILITPEQMNFIFKRLSRKNNKENNSSLGISFKDFKTSFLFLNIMSRFTEKNKHINQEDVDNLTVNKIEEFFEYLRLSHPFERKIIENEINNRRNMSVKEFFELQQQIKKEYLYKFKGNKSRSNSASYKIRPKSQNKIRRQSNGKIKTNHKRDLTKDNNTNNIRTIKKNISKKNIKTIEKNKLEENSGNTEDANVAEIFRDISRDNTTSEKFIFSNRSELSSEPSLRKNDNIVENNNNKENNNNNDKIDNNNTNKEVNIENKDNKINKNNNEDVKIADSKKLSKLKITNNEGKEENWNIEED